MNLYGIKYTLAIVIIGQFISISLRSQGEDNHASVKMLVITLVIGKEWRRLDFVWR